MGRILFYKANYKVSETALSFCAYSDYRSVGSKNKYWSIFILKNNNLKIGKLRGNEGGGSSRSKEMERVLDQMRAEDGDEKWKYFIVIRSTLYPHQN